MTSFQLYADGLQIVSSLLFEKHSTFQSLDLLNGFTCHTLGMTKKRKKNLWHTRARFSFILIAGVLLLLSLKNNEKIFFTYSIAEKKNLYLHFLLLFLL